jgi:hypothetical protein
MIHNNNYLMKRIQVQTYGYGVYIYFYINPLKFDHYYFKPNKFRFVIQ